MVERPLFGIGGNPVLHSRSPELFKILAGKKRNFDYVRVNADSAEELIGIFKDLGFSGMNITAPFKSDIIRFLNNIDGSAKKAGAVNLLKKEGGRINGYNTDYLGVVDSFRYNGIDIPGKKALVIGAGGAARAAIYGLKNEGAIVSVVNRGRERGESAASNLGIDLINKDDIEIFLKDTEIVVSTVESDSGIFDSGWIKTGGTLLTANYKKKSTVNTGPLHYSVLDGIDWLFFQGVPSFKILTGHKTKDLYPDYKKIKRKLSEEGKKYSKIYLTGFMGSGKSSVGKILAKTNGFRFYDIDREIELKKKLSIKEIFEKKGELYFRKIEKEALEIISGENNIVCSTGGGIVKNRDNREILIKDSVVVWIYSGLKDLSKRLDLLSRPLWNEKKPQEVEGLFMGRKNYYSETADIIVLNNRSAGLCAKNIFNEISKI